MLDRVCITCSKCLASRESSRASIVRWQLEDRLRACPGRQASYLGANCRQASSPPAESGKMPDFQLFLRLFGPGVLECDRSVPYLLIRSGIGIKSKIAQAFELIAF